MRAVVEVDVIDIVRAMQSVITAVMHENYSAQRHSYVHARTPVAQAALALAMPPAWVASASRAPDFRVEK
jgi:hypothetical protein